MFDLKEQIEVSIDGERVGVLDLNTRMSESDPEEQPRAADRAGARQGRPAPRLGGVHLELRRHPGRSGDAAREHAGRRLDRPGHHAAAAHARAADHRPVDGDRRLGHAEPAQDLHAAGRPPRAKKAPCAREIVSRLATQAFRGPVSGDDIRGLLSFYDEGRKRSDFESGVRLVAAGDSGEPALRVPLRRSAADGSPGQSYRLTDADLASRLSFFLWGTLPDAELLKVVASGTLRAPGVLDKQIKRMLADRASGSPGDAIRVAVAAPAGPREGQSRLPAVPAVRRAAGRGAEARDRALLRQPRARGSQPARSDYRRLHVRQRARGPALRHPERHRARSSGR